VRSSYSFPASRQSNEHVELCTKVAKALKDTSSAAAEYQQVVIELQGLQNVLARLAALEPTESNLQYVNAIRAAALANTLPLKDFLAKLKKFDKSMSPFASQKKNISLSGAATQTEYALFMAEEVKKIRAVIYGNVIRIKLMLAVLTSETVARTESRIATNQQDLLDKLKDTRDDMSKVVDEISELKAEVSASREEAERNSGESVAQLKEQLCKVDAETTGLTQNFSNLSVGITAISNSVSGIRALSSQILGLLRVIPSELGGLIQSVIRSNARMESILLRMDQKIPAAPSLLNDSIIKMEDALGRKHDLPYELFHYWEVSS
jgi:hypothetical protein